MKIKRIVPFISPVSVMHYFYFVIIHLNHNCTHDNNCPICSLIHKFKKVLDEFDPCLERILFFVLLVLFPKNFCLNSRLVNKNEQTPLGLKVELIN